MSGFSRDKKSQAATGSQAIQTSNTQTVSERSVFSSRSFSLFVDKLLSSLNHFVEKPVFSPRKSKSKTPGDPNEQIQGELLCFPKDLVSIVGSLAFVHSLVSVHCKSYF